MSNNSVQLCSDGLPSNATEYALERESIKLSVLYKRLYKLKWLFPVVRSGLDNYFSKIKIGRVGNFCQLHVL